MKLNHPHPGITMHQLSVGGNFPGLVFAAGTALIFLIAIPALWYVTVGALALGFLVAAGLQLARSRSPQSLVRVQSRTRLKWRREL